MRPDNAASRAPEQRRQEIARRGPLQELLGFAQVLGHGSPHKNLYPARGCFGTDKSNNLPAWRWATSQQNRSARCCS
jgi:hypothetical protein